MKRIISVAVASAVLGSSGASAHVSDAEFAELKAMVVALAAENQELNQQLRALAGAQVAFDVVTVEDLAATNAEIASLKKDSKSASWADRVKWKGDFRYRYEDIDEDDKDDRNRNRVRARAELVAKLPREVEVGLGMATGGEDPVSTNQTLGGGGSTKDIRLDLAYAKWKPMDEMYVMAGKFKNPFYRVQKSGLIWDGDFRPEGAAIGWANDMFFATASYNFIESDSKNDDDGIFGVQVGARFELGDDLKLTASAKYLDIPTKGRPATFDDDFFGNSSVNGEYLYDYKLFNGSLEASFSLFDIPLSVYGDYVQNDDADDLDTGYLVGVKLGKASKKGTWQVQYQYEDLEADATLGVVTDSDFAGGGTDGKGNKFSAKYAVDDKWYVGATYFDTSTGVDLGSDADFKRLQIDTGFKY